MPAIRVKLFAAARARAGVDMVAIECKTPVTIDELKSRLLQACPPLTPLLPRCAMAVNHDFATAETLISDADEVALIPPVSGG